LFLGLLSQRNDWYAFSSQDNDKWQIQIGRVGQRPATKSGKVREVTFGIRSNVKVVLADLKGPKRAAEPIRRKEISPVVKRHMRECPSRSRAAIMVPAAPTGFASNPQSRLQTKMSVNDKKHREIPIINVSGQRRCASNRPLQRQGMELS